MFHRVMKTGPTWNCCSVRPIVDCSQPDTGHSQPIPTGNQTLSPHCWNVASDSVAVRATPSVEGGGERLDGRREPRRRHDGDHRTLPPPATIRSCPRLLSCEFASPLLLLPSNLASSWLERRDPDARMVADMEARLEMQTSSATRFRAKIRARDPLRMVAQGIVL